MTFKYNNVYINEIIAEDFESDNQKIQIDMLGEYWLENIALPKKRVNSTASYSKKNTSKYHRIPIGN